MNLPEHNYYGKSTCKPCGDICRYDGQSCQTCCLAIITHHCDEYCPRCLIDQALAEQKAEMIAEVERKSYELMNRDDVASNTLSNIRFRTGYLTAINELLKGWKER